MEQDQRQKLNKALNKFNVHAHSVENSALPGTPDVTYISGWAECKYAVDWPKKEETPLRFEHFTPQQRAWLTEHWMLGGECWLCVQVSKTRDWLLFDGKTAARHVGRDGANKERLFELAVFTGHSPREIAMYITGTDNAHIHRLSS